MTWLKAAVVALVVTAAAVISVAVFHRGRWVETGAAPTTAATPSRPAATRSPTPSATPAPDWVGTWAVAMAHGTTTFDSRTVRQFVRTSIAGTAARVRLSNHYGTEPLVVRDVHLALAGGGGSGVDTDTDVAVTFDGDAEVTVAAGRSIASDPVTVQLPELADVAISFTVPGTSGAATMHTLANRNNFVAQGTPPAAAELSGANKASSYYFLAGLDVRNAAAKGALVAFGASITDGFGSTFGSNGRWPDLLARRLADSGRTVAVLNAGISGNKLTKDGAGERAVARFERDVLTQPGARWVIISDDALNDLGDTDPPPADDLIDALKDLVDRAHGGGLKAFCSTLTPFEGAGYWTQAGEAARQQINEFLRGDESGCDAVVDQDKATRDPDAPTKFRAAFDSGDHLHPNDNGMKAIAEAVDLTLFD